MTCEAIHVLPIQAREAEPWLLKKHYARRVPSIAHAFGLYRENILCGVVTYGIPANNNLNIVAGFPCLELNRLCVEDAAPKNSASLLVGRSLKIIPSPTVVVSYADRDQGHVGYIYQATNWLYTGLGAGDVEFEKDGKRSHRKALFNIFGTGSREVLENNGYAAVPVSAKHRYIYLVGSRRQKKEMAAALPWTSLPYPKGETTRYDAGEAVTVQTVLFSAKAAGRATRKAPKAKTVAAPANDNTPTTADMFAAPTQVGAA